MIENQKSQIVNSTGGRIKSDFSRQKRAALAGVEGAPGERKLVPVMWGWAQWKVGIRVAAGHGAVQLRQMPQNTKAKSGKRESENL